MHSALSIASLLLAGANAISLPQQSSAAAASAASYSADTEVRVILESQSTEIGSQTVFDKVQGRAEKAPVGSCGPFETFELSVGAGAKQDLRCQALDMNGMPIIGTRGPNVDITFSDGDGGAWKFVKATEVSKIICDESFVKAKPEDFQVTVTLAEGQEYSYDTVFKTVVERVHSPPTGSQGRFTQVEINVGAMANQDLRCQLIDRRGRKIVAKRNDNIDTTFSDSGKGPWFFENGHPRFVRNIICDPAFVAAPQ